MHASNHVRTHRIHLRGSFINTPRRAPLADFFFAAAASLGEMYRQLNAKGVRVPNGFATTAAAFRLFLSDAGLTSRISFALSNPKIASDGRVLASTGKLIRGWILDAQLPKALTDEITQAYAELAAERNSGEAAPAVAVRSSATAEDLPNASFAGASFPAPRPIIDARRIVPPPSAAVGLFKS